MFHYRQGRIPFASLLVAAAVCLFVCILFSACEPALKYPDDKTTTTTCTSTESTVTASIVGCPSISAAFIDQVLSAYHSPAAGKGQALYDLGVQYHIDPAWALAFFMHESTFGTKGEATFTLSLGNLRCIPNYPCPHGYAQFPSWDEGFKAWYKLMHDLYITQWGLTTIDRIIHHYAPAADHNDETAYCSALASAVQTWRAGQVYVKG